MSRLTYGSYLKIPALLSLQQRLSEPPHHDEMLFIVIHQVYELWFKQMLHEILSIRQALLDERPLAALKSFRRVHAIQRVLLAQIEVLETMTPHEFNAFRNLLRPASGFQSMQFREIELLSGGGDPKVLTHMEDDPALRQVQQRLGEVTLYQAFLKLLEKRGFAVPPALVSAPGGGRPPRPVEPALVETLREVYSGSEAPGRYELYLLAEAFVDYDELFLHWRSHHVRMVERTIGGKQGTGGSEGAAYLHRTLSARFFPELWEVRTVLGA